MIRLRYLLSPELSNSTRTAPEVTKQIKALANANTQHAKNTLTICHGCVGSKVIIPYGRNVRENLERYDSCEKWSHC
jgi:hypothetical protein